MSYYVRYHMQYLSGMRPSLVSGLVSALFILVFALVQERPGHAAVPHFLGSPKSIRRKTANIESVSARNIVPQASLHSHTPQPAYICKAFKAKNGQLLIA